MGLHLLNKPLHNAHILFRHGQFLNAPTLIERQVKEVDMVSGNAVIVAG